MNEDLKEVSEGIMLRIGSRKQKTEARRIVRGYVILDYS